MSGPFWQRLEVVDSTNDEARRLALAGAPSGTVVVARAQRAGRGRLGRSWYSPDAGNLYLSYLHRSRWEAARLPGLTLAAATAVAETLARAGLAPELEWPNDVLLGGRKLCGILCELHAHAGGHAVVIGVGLNLNDRMIPEALADRATSLALSTGEAQDVEAWAAAIAEALGRACGGFETSGAPDLDAYGRWFAMTGCRVEVADGDRRFRGAVLGVAPDGALRVRDERGAVVLVRSGEVVVEGRAR